MKLIDKSITDIISGYDDILKAETTLRNRWRPQLLAAYAQRKLIAEGQSSTSTKRQIQSLVFILFGIGFTLIGIGFSCRGVLQYEENILWFCCGGPLFIVFGLLILGAVWLSQKSNSKLPKMRTPLHPFRSGPNKHDIYPDLRTAWMDGICGDLHDQVPDYPDYINNHEKDHGALGERIFLQNLQNIFDDQTYALARLMLQPREDVDVILIGPKGLWVFEVKHWSGEIYWDDQGWRRVQTYFERGGVEVTKQPNMGESPDKQWIRTATQVRRSLKTYTPDILARYPALEQVRGGIVFSNEAAKLHFQPDRPVHWGTQKFWIKTLQNIEQKVNLDTHSVLELVEALLALHHNLTPIQQNRSMKDYAQFVLQDANAQLGAWTYVKDTEISQARR